MLGMCVPLAPVILMFASGCFYSFCASDLTSKNYVIIMSHSHRIDPMHTAQSDCSVSYLLFDSYF